MSSRRLSAASVAAFLLHPASHVGGTKHLGEPGSARTAGWCQPFTLLQEQRCKAPTQEYYDLKVACRAFICLYSLMRRGVLGFCCPLLKSKHFALIKSSSPSRVRSVLGTGCHEAGKNFPCCPPGGLPTSLFCGESAGALTGLVISLLGDSVVPMLFVLLALLSHLER